MLNLTTATEKTYTIAGVAEKNGTYFVRFANDAMRYKALVKDGQTDIRLVQLPQAMSKAEAVTLLQTLAEFADDNAQQAFTDFNTTGSTTTHRANRQNNEAGDQLYNYAGVACKHGEFKARWANTADRWKALTKDGQTDINLIQLPSPMTKYEAVMHIKDLDAFDYLDAQRAFDDYLMNNIQLTKVTILEEIILDKEPEVVATKTKRAKKVVA